MQFVGVFNKDGGTFRTTDMDAFAELAVTIFAGADHQLECRAVSGDELEGALDAAAADPSVDVILAGGGDGTISAAAGICFARGKSLAVLPAGTMNLFARSLGVPLQLEAALRAIAAGSLGAVDIATANGKPFVHQYSVGLHSRLVRIRNGLGYSSRWGKILASLRAVAMALSRPPAFDTEIDTPLGMERKRATAIAVSNNVLGEGHVPYAETVDHGVLGVYVVEPMPSADLARLALSLVFGNWKSHPLVSEKEVTRVRLSFPKRKSSALAVIDGELIPLERTVSLSIHARGLKVILPEVAPPVAPIAAIPVSV